MQFKYLSPVLCPIYNFYVSIFFFFFFNLGTKYWSVQPSSFHQNRRSVSVLLPHSPSFKKARKSQLKPLVWEFKELGRHGTSGKWECDLHGKSLKGHLLLHRSLSPRLLEVQAHGSGFLLENGANKHSTSRDRGLCLWEKDNQWTFKPRGWGKAYNLS